MLLKADGKLFLSAEHASVIFYVIQYSVLCMCTGIYFYILLLYLVIATEDTTQASVQEFNWKCCGKQRRFCQNTCLWHWPW